jgi:hypothetical protein
LDELAWELIGPAEALRVGSELLRLMEMPGEIPQDGFLPDGAGPCADAMIAALEDGLAFLLRREEETAGGGKSGDSLPCSIEQPRHGPAQS